MIAIKVWEIM